MHISENERKKWNAESTKSIFVGYCINKKSYRLWNPVTKLIHESRNVIFFENDFDGRVNPSPKTEDNLNSEIILPSSSQSDKMESADDASDNEERVVNHDDDLGVDEVNNEKRDIPCRSTRNRRPPERDNVLTGNWWEIDEALYTRADNILGEPKSIK